jgi:hypothetical protein
LAPTSAHLPSVAAHIGKFLKTPDLVFLQEIQDDSGPTDDGVVTANKTLTTLVNAIADVTGVTYSFIEIAPVNGQDGGQPGGNIRVAYLYVVYSASRVLRLLRFIFHSYRPERLTLVKGVSVGGSTDRVEVTKKGFFIWDRPSLTYAHFTIYTL